MDSGVKKKWVDALRGGEYKQTSRALRDSKGYCCLGVLCDLHSKETNTPWDGNKYLNSMGLLPTAVVEWAGLVNHGQTVFVENTMADADYPGVSLSGLNDSHMYTFDQIADVIEKQL